MEIALSIENLVLHKTIFFFDVDFVPPLMVGLNQRIVICMKFHIFGEKWGALVFSQQLFIN